MAHLNSEQEQVLSLILNTIVDEGKEPVLAQLIAKHDLLEAMDKNNYEETTIEDVKLIADNDGYDITDEQAENIAGVVMSNYDSSGYDDFITESIETELRGE